ncbi:hypothetical protein [Microcoleus anatoxicus]|uniref:hypothetical protein n=1 Tax=Microcoleus anatoxicus TaxID=2705319 RepID=UPI0030C99B04
MLNIPVGAIPPWLPQARRARTIHRPYNHAKYTCRGNPPVVAPGQAGTHHPPPLRIGLGGHAPSTAPTIMLNIPVGAIPPWLPQARAGTHHPPPLRIGLGGHAPSTAPTHRIGRARTIHRPYALDWAGTHHPPPLRYNRIDITIELS